MACLDSGDVGDIQIYPRRERQWSRFRPQTPEGGLRCPLASSFSLKPSPHLQTVFLMRSQIYRLGHSSKAVQRPIQEALWCFVCVKPLLALLSPTRDGEIEEVGLSCQGLIQPPAASQWGSWRWGLGGWAPAVGCDIIELSCYGWCQR